ncbi:MAG: phospholipase D family protein [Proteobacteria bacterium]|nr:phospholipase D family protein [Pseudomonadota bacterium]
MKAWFAARRRAWAGLGLILALLQGCSSLPPQPQRPDTHAIADYAETPLARMMAGALPADGRSGFRLMPYGPNSLATRIELARLATRTLDVQYYHLAIDNTGLALMRALRDAAARGVRVRLLMDDLYTAGEDDMLLALASCPNIELRLFNPFPGSRNSSSGRFLASLFDIGRIDRRMHNKLFVADNAAAVAGGRNMADEYVDNASGSNFVDMDVIAAGPVVRDLSQAFDYYWNSDVVYPIQAIASSNLDPAQAQDLFERKSAAATPPKAADPNGGSPANPGEAVAPFFFFMLDVPFELRAGRMSALEPANARVLFDPVTKTRGKNEREGNLHGTVTEGVVRWLITARRNIRMVSPYFVPSDAAVQLLRDAHEHGVQVDVYTNSLASTDEPWVYVGYTNHLPAMLDAGVRVHELSPSLSVKRRRLGILGPKQTGALHAKVAIRDDDQIFVGSMNLDQRSAQLNTEMGIIIDSPSMVRQFVTGLLDAGSAYTVRKAADGSGLEWVETDDDGRQTLHRVPPETSAWLRFKLRLLTPFIPEKEL